MKRTILLPAILTAAGLVHAQTACGSSAKYCTPVQAYGRLQAKSVGGKGGIYDSSGTRQVVLRGMSMYWSSEPCGYKFFNSSVVQWLQKDWNVSVLRVPLAVEKAPSSAATNKGYVDDSAVTVNRVLAVVNSAIAQGLYVVIDWHCPETNPYTSKAVSLFRSLAAKFKNTPNVLFEIWNEPTVGSDQIVSHANSVISAIRAAGNTSLVIVGSPGWSSQPNSVGAPTDPANNLAYTLHFYSSEGSHASYVNSNMPSAISAGRAVFITEWGATTADGKSGYSWPTSLLGTVESNKVSSCNWNIGNPLKSTSDPTSTEVEGSAALLTTANASGSWTDAMLTQDGKDAKSWISGKNAGMFTPPDTSLQVLVPMSSDSDSVAVGANTNLTITFNKAVSINLKITGQTSGAYYSTTSSGDDLALPWNSTKKALASTATFQPGELVKAEITNLPTLAASKLSTTFHLRKNVGIERTRRVEAFAWSAQGLRLPLGAVDLGETYRVRVLDLQGRQVGATHTATARASAGQVTLELPAVQGQGVAVVELQGPRGPVVLAVLPPVRN